MLLGLFYGLSAFLPEIHDMRFGDAIIDITRKRSFPGNSYPNDSLDLNTTYRIRIFPVAKGVRVEECVRFLFHHNALFVGKEGLQLMGDRVFLRDGAVLSFDRNRRYEEYVTSMANIGADPIYPDFSVWENRANGRHLSRDGHEDYSPRSSMEENRYLLCVTKKA